MLNGFQFWPPEIRPSLNNVVLFDLWTHTVCVTASSLTICSGRSQLGVLSESLEFLGRFGLFPWPMRAHLTSLETAVVYQLASGSLGHDLHAFLAPALEVRSTSQRCTIARYHCTCDILLWHFSM